MSVKSRHARAMRTSEILRPDTPTVRHCASSAQRRCSTATTLRSTSSAGCCRRTAPKSCTSGTTAASRTSSVPPSRKTRTPSPAAPTRAGTTSTSATWWTCCASTAPSTSGSSSAAAARSRRTRSRSSHAYGVERIYTPEDGRKLGLDGMIDDVFARVRRAPQAGVRVRPGRPARPQADRTHDFGTGAGRGRRRAQRNAARAVARSTRKPPVVGITGTGGAGKSSLTDELLMRFVRHFPDRNIAVVAMDPTRRRSGGALLGDRIRMNSLAEEQVFMRSLATRRAAPRHQRRARRRPEPAQVRGLRPDRDRDRGHRPERLRDRRPGRRADVRHDERIRRGEPAREDRHARFRRR